MRRQLQQYASQWASEISGYGASIEELENQLETLTRESSATKDELVAEMAENTSDQIQSLHESLQAQVSDIEEDLGQMRQAQVSHALEYQEFCADSRSRRKKVDDELAKGEKAQGELKSDIQKVSKQVEVVETKVDQLKVKQRDAVIGLSNQMDQQGAVLTKALDREIERQEDRYQNLVSVDQMIQDQVRQASVVTNEGFA